MRNPCSQLDSRSGCPNPSEYSEPFSSNRRSDTKGPVYEDFLKISGKHDLDFDQDQLEGHTGTGAAESARWDWDFK